MMFGLMPSQGAAMGLMPTQQSANPDALKMALLQAGLGIMGARTGGNLGAAIAQGGQQGLQAFQSVNQAAEQSRRQDAYDAMQQGQFGMQQKKFEAEQAQAAEQAARQKAFEDAVKDAYILDEQGNVTGIDQGKYQAALAMADPDAAAKMFYQQQTKDNSYFQALPTATGYAKFNARTGDLEPIQMGGAPIIRPQDDPALRGRITAAETGGKVTGESQATAAVNLQSVESAADSIIAAIDDIEKDPARVSATGASRMLGAQKIPGTAAYDFDAKLANLQGKVFKEAFQSMKGAGAITEQEGKAAERAIANLDAAQSEQQFLSALQGLKSEINRLRDVARQKAGGITSPDQPLNLQLKDAPQPQSGGGWGIRKL